MDGVGAVGVLLMLDDEVVDAGVDFVLSVLPESASLILDRDAPDDVRVEVIVDLLLSLAELSNKDESASSSSSASKSSDDDLVVGKADSVNAGSVVVE